VTQSDFGMVTVPQLGVNDRLATVNEWYIEDGAEVGVGQPICALETTKAEFDVESHVAGFIVTLVEPHSSVETGQLIALVGASMPILLEEKARRTPTPIANGRPGIATDVSVGDRQATRSAIAEAQRLGIDIDLISGRGIIRESDVTAFHRSTSEPAPAPDLDLTRNPDLISVVVYGAGAGAVTVKECLDLGSEYEVVCFIDDDPNHAESLSGRPVYGSDRLGEIVDEGVIHVAVAIAAGAVRMRILNAVEAIGARIVTVIHPTALVAPSASIGEGSFIKAGAIVETNTSVGRMCIIDNGAILPHDNELGDACHVAPGASLGSGIKVGGMSIIGIGASVATGVTIGEAVIVTPGSVVTEDLADFAIADGNPAKVIGSRRSGV
jgi:UDP-perosamine 4-acetyltransferase